MNCPMCNEKTKVIDSRVEDDCIRRRRVCLGCSYRFFTVEIDEDFYEKSIKKEVPKDGKVH
jgi:transcriptional regulator NrdR family protein